MTFSAFKDKVDESFQQMCKDQTKLFRVEVDKDLIWSTYLNSFPEEERQEHNCNCCRQFIKNWGNVVAIKNNKVITFWDFECEEPYKTVANNLKSLILSRPVTDLLVQTFAKLGTNKNTVLLPDGTTKTWKHLFTTLPNNLVYKGGRTVGTELSNFRSAAGVFVRSMNEITTDAVDTVLELIQQNSLYRGSEFKGMVDSFKRMQKEYLSLPSNQQKIYAISHVQEAGAVASIRNHAIGTLLVDLSEGMDLDTAVTRFEKIMAPISCWT